MPSVFYGKRMSTNAVSNAEGGDKEDDKSADRPRRMTWTAPRGVMSRLSTPFFPSNSAASAANGSNSSDDTVQVLSPRNHDLLVKENSFQDPNLPANDPFVETVQDDELQVESEDLDFELQRDSKKLERNRERRDSMMKLHSEVQEKLKALGVSRRGSRRQSLGEWSAGSGAGTAFVSDWRRSRDKVEVRMYWSNLNSAIFGFTGAIFACAQNELIIRGTDPQHVFVNTLKAINTILTCIAIGFLYRRFWLDELFSRILRHLRILHELDIHVPPSCILQDASFWAETLFILFHIPPFVTFEIPMMNWNNFLVYRAETLGAAINVLRVFLFWGCFREWVLGKLPRRHTVASFTRIQLNSAFTIKLLLNGRYAVHFIAILWLILLLISGYWFRAVELTACQFGTSKNPNCGNDNAKRWIIDFGAGSLSGQPNYFTKVNDPYLQNALWSMFQASTTVGFGDITSTTHAGRIVAAMTSVIGLVMVAMLTSSLMHRLQFSAEEESAMLMVAREKAWKNLSKHSATFLKAWLMARKGIAKKNKKDSLFQLKQIFKTTKNAANVHTEDCMAEKSKLDLIVAKTKRLCEISDVLKCRIFPLECNRPQCQEEIEELLMETEAKTQTKPQHHRLRRRSSAVQMQRKLSSLIAIMKDFMPAKHDWKKNRKLVDDLLRRNRMLAALFGMLGTLFAIVENELVFAGLEPHTPAMDVMKGLSSLSTVGCLVFIYRIYWTQVLIRRLVKHLHHGAHFDYIISVSHVLDDPLLWVEMIVVGLHLPPFTTFELGSNTMGNYVLYQAETVFCSWNIIRVYLLWRVIADWMVSDIPSKHSIGSFTGVKFDTSFVLKRMLNSWSAIYYLAFLWTFVVFVGGYLFRNAEATACLFPNVKNVRCESETAKVWSINGDEYYKFNDMYFLNACWFIFTTITPGAGNGTIATTHFGRCVAAIAMLFGILLTSIAAAALGNLITFSSSEHTALGVLGRETARVRLHQCAVNIISLWWRRKRKAKLSRMQRGFDFHALRKEFVSSKEQVKRDVEDFGSRSEKIDAVANRVKHLDASLSKIAGSLLLRAKEDKEEGAGGRSSETPAAAAVLSLIKSTESSGSGKGLKRKVSFLHDEDTEK